MLGDIIFDSQINQKYLFDYQIKEKLNFLKEKLPKQPTAVKNLYSLPTHYVEEVKESNYSQSSLQKISDHIGYYLGLLKSVKITFLEEFDDKRWVSSSDGVVVAGNKNKSPVSGLYKVVGFDRSEILLIKKPKFKIKHMIAILAHEYTHNYLYHHGIRDPNELENEILTDIAAAYLGLGHLLIPGYGTISWTDSSNEYCAWIGYIMPDAIRNAIIMSAELRSWDPKEVVANFSATWDKIVAYFKLWSYRTKYKKMLQEKQKRDYNIKSLKEDADEINNIYNQVRELVKNITSTKPSLIAQEDGPVLVEITNKISVGELEVEIKSIAEKLEGSRLTSFSNEDISQLASQVDDLKNTLTSWHKLLCKYSTK